MLSLLYENLGNADYVAASRYLTNQTKKMRGGHGQFVRALDGLLQQLGTSCTQVRDAETAKFQAGGKAKRGAWGG